MALNTHSPIASPMNEIRRSPRDTPQTWGWVSADELRLLRFCMLNVAFELDKTRVDRTFAE
ncbi:hypothetical protein PpBr36_02055 [Pyricularia pennisetigena]|uniref:hypothetical protein n=1 Tax=Pyricularia pennisetigena TaxID=1578925 RepID=UPI00114E85A9|nr:hypothetical protein PpBr36_02055 [Pyricularia pennisetigena]TLS28930.1 hypothetical protein PpBr36_02055 [Pyricularia pennisetigena]